MTWITPGGTSEQIAQTFRDFEPYPFVLTAVQIAPSNKPDAGDSFLFTFALEGRPEITVRCYAGKSLGEYQGRVAKLRAILNALFAKPENAAIAGVDDETFQVRYADETQNRAIIPGLRLVARGRFTPRQDGSAAYKLEVFQAAGTFAQPPASFSAPAASAVSQPPHFPASAAAAPVAAPVHSGYPVQPVAAAPAAVAAPVAAMPVPVGAVPVAGGWPIGQAPAPTAPAAPPTYADGTPITSQPPF